MGIVLSGQANAQHVSAYVSGGLEVPVTEMSDPAQQSNMMWDTQVRAGGQMDLGTVAFNAEVGFSAGITNKPFLQSYAAIKISKKVRVLLGGRYQNGVAGMVGVQFGRGSFR